MTIAIKHTENEWKLFAKAAKEEGYNTFPSIIFSKLKKVDFNSLELIGGRPVRKYIYLHDEQLITDLNKYCEKNDIHPAVLIRHLISEPLIQKRLLAKAVGS